MKSAMILAALCAAFCASAPVTVQAKGMSDMDLYCKFMPMTSKCATPAKATPAPAAKPAAMAKPATAKPAAVKPVASVKPAKMSIKTMACVKAAPGSGHIYSCTWSK